MTEIVLSRRNILALLSKLDEPGSACTIIKPDGTVVRAVEDGEAYVGRNPGEMHPNTETALDLQRISKAFLAAEQEIEGLRADVDHWRDEAAARGDVEDRLRAALQRILDCPYCTKTEHPKEIRAALAGHKANYD